MSTAFDAAQARYDAAEPPDDEPAPADPIGDVLEDLISLIDRSEVGSNDIGEVHTLSDRQATVGVWIDGHEYSLVLNRED